MPATARLIHEGRPGYAFGNPNRAHPTLLAMQDLFCLRSLMNTPQKARHAPPGLPSARAYGSVKFVNRQTAENTRKPRKSAIPGSNQMVGTRRSRPWPNRMVGDRQKSSFHGMVDRAGGVPVFTSLSKFPENRGSDKPYVASYVPAMRTCTCDHIDLSGEGPQVLQSLVFRAGSCKVVIAPVTVILTPCHRNSAILEFFASIFGRRLTAARSRPTRT